MKTKISFALTVLCLIIVLSGCGGGNSGTPVTSSSSYNDGSSNNVLNAIPHYAAKPEGSTLFSDTFSDAAFSDGWLPLIQGNFSISQQSGALTIAGDATSSPCTVDECFGVAGLETLIMADPFFPVAVNIAVDISGSVAVNGASSGAVFQLADVNGNEFRVFLFTAGPADTFCQGTCLGYSYTGLITPVVLLQNVSKKARLGISYQNGSFVISFTAGPTVTATVSGPIFSGAVAGRLSGVTRYDPSLGINPADVILQLKADNASLQGTLTTACDVSISQQSVQNAIDVVQSVVSDMEANGVSAGLANQLGIVLPKLNAALQSLQTGQYSDSLNQLRGTLGPLQEAQRGLLSQRGRDIPSVLVDQWVNDLGTARGNINTIIQEAGTCT